MSEPEPEGAPDLPTAVEFIVPEALSAGIYSNTFATWFNQTDFTMDFSIHLPLEARTNDDGQQYLHVPIQVVARVKLAPTLMFRLIQQLNEVMTQYEDQFGKIIPLGDPIPPPADSAPPSPTS